MQATRRVSRGLGTASALEEALNPAIDGLRLTPIGTNSPMTWRELLDANHTDDLVILHRGKIVYGYYSGCLDREGRHGAMSVTKSFVGTIAELLIAEGVLDASAPVTRYVPELADSAFGSATLRQVMDMTRSPYRLSHSSSQTSSHDAPGIASASSRNFGSGSCRAAR